jgi:hypothetical protein
MAMEVRMMRSDVVRMNKPGARMRYGTAAATCSVIMQRGGAGLRSECL